MKLHLPKRLFTALLTAITLAATPAVWAESTIYTITALKSDSQDAAYAKYVLTTKDESGNYVYDSTIVGPNNWNSAKDIVSGSNVIRFIQTDDITNKNLIYTFDNWEIGGLIVEADGYTVTGGGNSLNARPFDLNAGTYAIGGSFGVNTTETNLNFSGAQTWNIASEKTLQLDTKQKIVIGGDYDSSSPTATVTFSGGTTIFNANTEVKDGSTLIAGEQSKLVFNGTLSNSGNITIQSGAKLTVDSTIVNNGTMELNASVYTDSLDGFQIAAFGVGKNTQNGLLNNVTYVLASGTGTITVADTAKMYVGTDSNGVAITVTGTNAAYFNEATDGRTYYIFTGSAYTSAVDSAFSSLNSGVIYVASGATLNGDSTTSMCCSTTLTGSGTYDTNGSAMAENLSLGTNWSGTVILSGGARGTQLTTFLTDLYNSNSKVALRGFTSWLGTNVTAHLVLLKETDVNYALDLNNGYSGGYADGCKPVFVGAISGDGHIGYTFTGTKTGAEAIHEFRGNTSGWDGRFINDSNSGMPKMLVKFTSGGQVFSSDGNGGVEDKHSTSKTTVEINSTSATHFYGSLVNVKQLNIKGDTTLYGALGVTDGVAIDSGKTLTLSNGDTNYSGVITGTGNLTKVGEGAVTLGGTIGTENEFFGTLSVGSGSVNLQNTSYLTAMNITGGSATVNNGTIKGLVVTGGSVNLTGNATIGQTGENMTVGPNKDRTSGIYGYNGTITIGGGETSNTVTTTRVEFGDINETNKGGILTVATNATLIITGNGGTAASTTSGNYGSASFLMGEWGSNSTLNVSGLVLAQNAPLLNGDKQAIININNGGVLAVKGIGRNGGSGVNLTLSDGAKLILGSDGMQSTSTLTTSLNAGTIGIYSDTTISKNLSLDSTSTGTTFDTQLYEWGEGGASISQGEEGGSLTISGVLSGSGKLVKTGAGTLTLSAANTYSGGTTVTAGTLSVANVSSLGSGAVTVQSGATLEYTGITDGTLASLVTSGAGGSTSTVSVTGTGMLTVTSLTSTNTLEKSGTGTLELNSAIANKLSVEVDAGMLEFCDSLSEDRRLSNATVNAGTLKLSRTDTIDYDSTVAITVGQNAVLDLNSRQSVNGNSSITLNGGKVTGSGGTNSYSVNSQDISVGLEVYDGTQTINSSGTSSIDTNIGLRNGGNGVKFNVTSGTLTNSGIIVGRGSVGKVIKSGEGTLILTGANSYHQGTSISAGKLIVQDSGTLGSGSVEISGGAELEFDEAGDRSFANAISNSGTVTKSGTGNITLNGVVSGEGKLSVTGGTLTLSGGTAESRKEHTAGMVSTAAGAGVSLEDYATLKITSIPGALAESYTNGNIDATSSLNLAISGGTGSVLDLALDDVSILNGDEGWKRNSTVTLTQGNGNKLTVHVSSGYLANSVFGTTNGAYGAYATTDLGGSALSMADGTHLVLRKSHERENLGAGDITLEGTVGLNVYGSVTADNTKLTNNISGDTLRIWNTGGVEMTGALDLSALNVEASKVRLSGGTDKKLQVLSAKSKKEVELAADTEVQMVDDQKNTQVRISSGDGINAATMTAKTDSALIQMAQDASFTIADMTLTNTSLTAAETTTKVNLSNVSVGVDSVVTLAKGAFAMQNQATVGMGGSGCDFTTSSYSGFTLGTADSKASITLNLGDLSQVKPMGPRVYERITILLEDFHMTEGNASILFAADSWLGQLLSSQGANAYVSGSLDAPESVSEGGSSVSVSYSAATGSNVGTIITITGLNVPEPTTSTLSLLALAGLCARRRRKM